MKTTQKRIVLLVILQMVFTAPIFSQETDHCLTLNMIEFTEREQILERSNSIIWSGLFQSDEVSSPVRLTFIAYSIANGQITHGAETKLYTRISGSDQLIIRLVGRRDSDDPPIRIQLSYINDKGGITGTPARQIFHEFPAPYSIGTPNRKLSLVSQEETPILYMKLSGIFAERIPNYDSGIERMADDIYNGVLVTVRETRTNR